MTATRKLTVGSVLIGIGLGGFVDGILLHQILQWHNMLSSARPPVDMESMKLNMLWDGVFHAGVWFATLAGALLVWAEGRAGRRFPPHRWFLGSLLIGWGLFNLVEGLIDHHILGIHHVRYTPPGAWDNPSLPWDLGFLLVGGLGFILLGLLMSGRATAESR